MSAAPAPSAQPAPLPSVIQLFTVAKDLIRARLGYFVSLTLVTEFLVPIIAVAIAGLAVVLTMFLYGATRSWLAIIVAGVVALALFVCAVILKIVLSLAPMIAVDEKSMTSIKEAIKRAWPKAADAFLVSLMMGLLIVIGFVLLFFPGLYLAVVLAFSLWAVVLDNKSGSDALKQSRDLVRGRWWAVFGRLAALIVIVWIVIALPANILQSLGLEIWGSLYALAISLLTTPFAVAYSYLLYQALKGKSMDVPSQMS